MLYEEKNRLVEADYERVLAWNRQREIFIHDANKHYVILEELLDRQEYERALQYVKNLKQNVRNIVAPLSA